jgi:hypothetical protein
MGGALVDSLTSLVIEGRTILYEESGQMEQPVTTYYSFPHSFRRDVRLSAGMLGTVVTPEGAFLLGPAGTVELPEEKRYEIERSIVRNPVAFLKTRRQKRFEAAFSGTGRVGDEPVEIVRVEIGGEPTTVAISSANGRILQMRYLARGGADEHLGEAVALFSDFRRVDGLTYPFATTGHFEGKKSASTLVERVKVNEPLPGSLFLARPTGAAPPERIPSPSGGP